MAIAKCPKCSLEFLAGDQLGRPQVCPACAEKFLFAPGADAVAASAPASSQPSPGRIRFAGLATAFLGLIVDGLLLAGNLAYLVEASARGGVTRADIFASTILLLALLAHAALSLSAYRMLTRRPDLSLLLGRLAVLSWLLLGGAAIWFGAHIWPNALAGEPGYLMFACCVALGLVLTYLGGLEWLSQTISKQAGRQA